jgi:hypothetical protein
VDITAIHESGGDEKWTERSIEGSFASLICNYFKKVTQ